MFKSFDININKGTGSGLFEIELQIQCKFSLTKSEKCEVAKKSPIPQ